MKGRNLLQSGAGREWSGEILGTFILVLFGCGSVATAVLTGAQVGIFQVAVVWGIGIALAIQLTSALSGAHLNPAVTLALATAGRLPWSKVPRYVVAQLIGAFAAAAVLNGLFAGALAEFEAVHSVTRGAPGSEVSAMVFAEFFPNPGWKPLGSKVVSAWQAFAVEGVGTAVLMTVILGVTDSRNSGRSAASVPWSIGFTVTILISLFGPLTMACFNPARDLAPRLYAAFAGWGGWVFQANGWGWLTVFVAAPVVGAQLGALTYHLLLAPGYGAAPTSPIHKTGS